jgi:DnaJ-class molecular chaperone
MVEEVETCPACKGTGTLGTDGHGYNYICEWCQGLKFVVIDRASDRDAY